ncbi:MAG: DUF1566 domain-containing protein [Proteobacteria bacterium]|nr:DUF1566 domain-containing protein [Pseudomonadota bacterium]
MDSNYILKTATKVRLLALVKLISLTLVSGCGLLPQVKNAPSAQSAKTSGRGFESQSNENIIPLALSSPNTPIIITPSTANVCSGIIYTDKTGTERTGTGSCVNGAASTCTSDGQINCKTSSAFPAAKASSLSASLIRSGDVIGAVTGTYGVSACTSDAQVGCLATTAFPSASQPTASEILSGSTILGVSGTYVIPSNCSSNGQSSCFVTGAFSSAADCVSNGSDLCYLPTYLVSTKPFRAFHYDSLASNSSKIKSGQTIGGVSGSLNDCNASLQANCKSTSSYVSILASKAVPSNFKNGETVYGLTGNYPSVGTPLASSTATDDLTSSNFQSKITSSSAFEFFDSAGNRHTANGDSDLIPQNILSPISLFGLTGTSNSIGPEHVKYNVAANGVTGSLKADCRNGGNLTQMDMSSIPKLVFVDSGTDTFTLTGHGFVATNTVKFIAATVPGNLAVATIYYVINATTNTFQVSTTSGGSAVNLSTNGTTVFIYKVGNATIDYWDTLDDSATAPLAFSSAWTSNGFQCGDVGPELEKNWESVTTCDATTCILRDKQSGLQWAKAEASTLDFSSSISTCSGKDYGGFTDWRLPTQKELLEAYVHRILSTGGLTYWTTAAEFSSTAFWSATLSSQPPNTSSHAVYLSTGGDTLNTHANTLKTMCVRP